MMLSSKNYPEQGHEGEHVTKIIARANTDARGFSCKSGRLVIMKTLNHQLSAA
jgi:hypothetical protein